MAFFSKTKIKASQIMEQAVSFLSAKYDQAANVFTSASPFGQLLIVIANISELIFTYISHVAEELNIHTAQNAENIFGLSRLTGHDPYRGSSAYGSMGLKLNTSTDLIKGNYLIIKNFTRFQITETGQTYFLNLPSEYLKLDNNLNSFVEVKYTQGIIESQTFTSDGTPLQTFNPIVKNMTDHDNVSVTVNDKVWKKVDSLYDMPADDGYDNSECFMVKSSINVGLTIIFGNGSFGAIPPKGSKIVVSYIKTDGSAGNANSTNLTYTFMDSGTDEYGNDVDLNELLCVETIAPPMLGSDFENPEFTKLIAPRTSKSFVLARPENYVTFLSRYNQFSFIYAYNTKDNAKQFSDYENNRLNSDIENDKTIDDFTFDDNVTYLKVSPNLKKKLLNNQDYFDLPTNEFLLTDEERQSIIDALDNSGQMMVNSEVQVITPRVEKFAINVIIRYFENCDKNSIRADIRNIFAKYFLNINRNDIIPLSDLISLVEGVDGVDTCDVFFISERNESAMKRGYYYTPRKVWRNLSYETEMKKVTVSRRKDPRVGFDTFGNIIIDEDSICIPKGGWTDRDGNYYTETPETGKLGPLNIFFLDKVEYSAYNRDMQKKLTNLLKNNY